MSSVLPVKLLGAVALLLAAVSGRTQTLAGKDTSKTVLSISGTGISTTANGSLTHEPVVETDSSDFILSLQPCRKSHSDKSES